MGIHDLLGHRVGVVVNVRQNPLDPDFVNMTIYHEDSKKSLGETEPDLVTATIPVRQAEVEDIHQESIVAWGMFGRPHKVDDHKLKQLRVDQKELMEHYFVWVDAQSSEPVPQTAT